MSKFNLLLVPHFILKREHFLAPRCLLPTVLQTVALPAELRRQGL
jgi:hypothetical protein